MNLEEFAAKIDSDLVGKVVNLASRCAKFAAKTGLSAEYPDDGGLFEQAAKAGDEIAAAYEQCDYNKAMRLIVELAGHGNRFIDAAAHWKFKDDLSRAQELQDVCTIGLNLFRQIVIYLAPVLPALAKQTEELLATPIESWDDSQTPLVETPVAPFARMMNRVQKKDIDSMIEESKEEEVTVPATSPYNDSGEPLQAEPLAEQCTIDDFVKVDLRIARVLTADDVPEANKLLKLTLGLGGDETRTVFAGIKEAYKPEDLVGRLVVCCANLAPRKMKFGTSEGMILASGPGKADVFVLGVDEGGQPGQRVH
ncbi:MAG: methionine--tRNA ligase subunit beta, partial [Pirellulaceae bacterium]